MQGTNSHFGQWKTSRSCSAALGRNWIPALGNLANLFVPADAAQTGWRRDGAGKATLPWHGSCSGCQRGTADGGRWSYPGSVLVQCCLVLPGHLRREAAEWQSPTKGIAQPERRCKPHTPGLIHTILCIAAIFFSSLFDPQTGGGRVIRGELLC